MTLWTEERVELLRKLWLGQVSASLIARELGGISRSAVIGKIHRLGLCGRGKPTLSVKPQRKPRAAGRRTYRPVTIGNTALKMKPDARHEHEAAMLEPIAVPIAKMLTIETLTERTCKWPIGDPREGGFRFCGHDSLEGAPYCPYHTGVAYRSAR